MLTLKKPIDSSTYCSHISQQINALRGKNAYAIHIKTKAGFVSAFNSHIHVLFQVSGV